MSAPTRGACVYCGLPRARVQPPDGPVAIALACRGHLDLLALDPAYGLSVVLAAEVYPALELDPAPSSAHRERPTVAPGRALAVTEV